MTSAFRMGDGVLDKWKVFRRKSCDAIAMILKIDTDNEQVVLDGDFAETSPEVRHAGLDIHPNSKMATDPGLSRDASQDLQDEMSDSAPRWILWLFKVRISLACLVPPNTSRAPLPATDDIPS